MTTKHNQDATKCLEFITKQWENNGVLWQVMLYVKAAVSSAPTTFIIWI